MCVSLEHVTVFVLLVFRYVHGIPHGLSFGKVFAFLKVGPKAFLDFVDTYFGKESGDGLGVRHAGVAFVTNGIEFLFGIFHALFVSLTERIAREPTLGALVGVVGRRVPGRRRVLGVEIDRVQEAVVLSSLLQRQLRSTAHENQNENPKQIRSTQDPVAAGKPSGTPQNHATQITGFR